MDQIFYIMIKGTLIATVAGIGVLALKPVFAKKFSVKMRYFLWLIIFSCLIIPLQFPFEPLFNVDVTNVSATLNESLRGSSNGEIGNSKNNTGNTFATENIIATGNSNTTTNSITTNDLSVNHNTEGANKLDVKEQDIASNELNDKASGQADEEFMFSVIDLMVVIWVVGFSLHLLYHFIGYYIYLYKLSKNRVLEVDSKVKEIFYEVKKRMGILDRKKIILEVNNFTKGPVIVGFIRKKIILPNVKYEDDVLKMIFAHELTHYKHHDIAYKNIIWLGTVIHWFNPLIRVFRNNAYQDVELRCDESVIKDASSDEKETYANAIIGYSINRGFSKLAFTTNMGGSKMTLKERISGIFDTKGKRRGIIIGVGFVAAILVFSIGFGIGNFGGDNQNNQLAEAETTTGNDTDEIVNEENNKDVLASTDNTNTNTVTNPKTEMKSANSVFNLLPVNYNANMMKIEELGIVKSSEVNNVTSEENKYYYDTYIYPFVTDGLIAEAFNKNIKLTGKEIFGNYFTIGMDIANFIDPTVEDSLAAKSFLDYFGKVATKQQVEYEIQHANYNMNEFSNLINVRYAARGSECAINIVDIKENDANIIIDFTYYQYIYDYSVGDEIPTYCIPMADMTITYEKENGNVPALFFDSLIITKKYPVNEYYKNFAVYDFGSTGIVLFIPKTDATANIKYAFKDLELTFIYSDNAMIYNTQTQVMAKNFSVNGSENKKFLISVALSDNFYDGNVVLIPVEEDLVGLVDMNSNMLYNKYGEHIYYYK